MLGKKVVFFCKPSVLVVRDLLYVTCKKNTTDVA